uniref:hypothetical protein n=1 Tax=Xanthomonas sp. 0924 TaxID=2835534 RepID=UPI003F816003
MAHFTQWLKLERSEVAPRHKVEGAEWAFQSPSLYDIPTHARAKYDADNGHFIVQFRYLIMDEPYVDRAVGDHLTLTVGKKTGRVFCIDADLFNLSRSRSAMKRSPELEEGASEVALAIRGSSASNGHIASRALESKKRKLLDEARVI